MENAPLYTDLADGPPDGRAWWLRTTDGVRIRIGYWPATAKTHGAILLMPGRTEYIEKYGRTARDLATLGYGTLVIDWRGQGLADRLVSDAMSGHVIRFGDYQTDLAAVMQAAEQLGLPRPMHLLAHSMGGCIGLRAVMDGLDVASCVFSGPMWGIQMANALRPIAWSLSWGGRQLGMGHVYAPGTAAGSYVLTEPFESNKLTRDSDMYNYMINHLREHPELGLGGPSLRWLNEALRETRDLSRLPSPELPCMTLLGSEEVIVDVPRIHNRMHNWAGSQLEIIPNGRHEVLMENAGLRADLAKRIADFCQNAEIGEKQRLQG